MNAANWRRAAVAPAAWLPWLLVGLSSASALFGAWSIWGAEGLIAFLVAWWPWLLIGAAAVVSLSVFVWWLWWRLPKRQLDRLRAPISDAKARADAEDNFRKTAGQLLGGAAVLIGAGLAYLQFTQQQQTSHEQFSDQLISNQVSKGFELLGEKDPSKRLGGIYALESVMNGSEPYHKRVLEGLCAFVREQTGEQTNEQTGEQTGKKTGEIIKDNPLPVDVQAALTVIVGRKEVKPGDVNLTGVSIPNALLPQAHLAGAFLREANLTGIHLRDADLTGAHLRGALLTGADLRGAHLNHARLAGAHLLGIKYPLTQDQVDDACSDEETQIDPKLTLAKLCPPDQSDDAGSSK